MIFVRNDDVHVGTDLGHLYHFCEICDRHEARIIQAITPFGNLRPLYNDGAAAWDNRQIQEQCGDLCIRNNRELVRFLRDRQDVIALHGWEHLHYSRLPPAKVETHVLAGILLLADLFNRKPEFLVAPFNEWDPTMLEIHGLRVLAADSPHLEEILLGREPVPENPDNLIYRCHSWRFGERFSYQQLDETLRRIKEQIPLAS